MLNLHHSLSLLILEVQQSLLAESKYLSIILYSDVTICDHLGKSSKHPILGNIINWRRIKPDAKVLLGYLPILKAKTISQKDLKAINWQSMHALDTLIRPLLDYTNDSFDLQTVNNILWCYPFIFI